jgi:glutamate racemase
VNTPIGVFDSGVGGLTVWNALVDLLDRESTVYYCDAAYAPYGNRTKEEIVERSIKATNFLIDKGCKLILVACNTATTNAIAELRTLYDLPFVGIEPAIKPAALMTKTKKVGVLATKGTLYSSMFHKTVTDYTSGIKLITQEGKGLVEAIESNEDRSQELKELLEAYIVPMLEQKVDTLVLGCTHYPYLIPMIESISKGTLKIIEASLPVALQLKKRLEDADLLADSTQQTHQFYTSGDLDLLKRFVRADLREHCYRL